MIFFSAEFSSTYFDYAKNEVKDRELSRTQDFGKWIWGSSPYETAN